MEEIVQWYKNPDIWIATFTFLAIILSQLSPIKTWFKKGKLEIDIYSQGFINHSIGNPLFQLHLIISNIGLKKIKIIKISTEIYKENTLIATLPSLNYIPNTSDGKTIMLTKFNIEPLSEWSNILNFQKTINREEQKVCRDISLIIQDKVSEANIANSNEITHVSKKTIKPLKKMFKEKFIWEPARYRAKILIETDDIKTNKSKEIDFTLFEIQINELKKHTEGYTAGDTVYWNSGKFTGVFIDIE